MARGVNKVILIGNLGDEPLCRTTHSGSSVTNISMVTNEVRRNLETGEFTEYAEWHRVVMWGKLAEMAKQYLHKGNQIYVEGKIRTRSFLDKQGQKRSVTEIVADEMQMLGSRPQQPLPPEAAADVYQPPVGGGAPNSYARNRQVQGGFGAPAQPYGQNPYGGQAYGGNQGYGQNAYGANQGYAQNRIYGQNAYANTQRPRQKPGFAPAQPYGLLPGGSYADMDPAGMDAAGPGAPAEAVGGSNESAAPAPVAPAAVADGTKVVSENKEPSLKMDDEIPF